MFSDTKWMKTTARERAGRKKNIVQVAWLGGEPKAAIAKARKPAQMQSKYPTPQAEGSIVKKLGRELSWPV
jgi:hypothetical protein